MDDDGSLWRDTTETFGSMAWSHDEKSLAYVAEAKKEEKDFPSFWDVTPKEDPNKADEGPVVPSVPSALIQVSLKPAFHYAAAEGTWKVA